MADSKKWKAAASISAGLAIASILAIIALASPGQKWGNTTGGFILGGAEEAERLANPYGIQAVDLGGKFALIQGSGNGARLQSLVPTVQYSGAMASGERIVVARWSDGFTAIFLKGFTLKEALTLAKNARLAEEFAKASPVGAFALLDEEVLGKSWLALVRENWVYIILGSAMLYFTYIIFYALFSRPYREE